MTADPRVGTPAQNYAESMMRAAAAMGVSVASATDAMDKLIAAYNQLGPTRDPKPLLIIEWP